VRLDRQVTHSVAEAITRLVIVVTTLNTSTRAP
jgi:hypothetical protein